MKYHVIVDTVAAVMPSDGMPVPENVQGSTLVIT